MSQTDLSSWSVAEAEDKDLRVFSETNLLEFYSIFVYQTIVYNLYFKYQNSFHYIILYSAI